MIMSDTLYDLLRNIADLVLPAAGTLYFALSGIWGLPYAEQIVGSITAVTAFLDVVLKVSKTKYDNDKGAHEK